MTELKRQSVYDELSAILTLYEEEIVGEKELYIMLCKIQTCWEDIITAGL